MSKWISVETKLPEKEQPVLAHGNGSDYIAWIDGYEKENKPIWQYSWCCGCFCKEKITHWQAIPEPPKD